MVQRTPKLRELLWLQLTVNWCRRFVLTVCFAVKHGCRFGLLCWFYVFSTHSWHQFLFFFHFMMWSLSHQTSAPHMYTELNKVFPLRQNQATFTLIHFRNLSLQTCKIFLTPFVLLINNINNISSADLLVVVWVEMMCELEVVAAQ